MDWVTVQKLCKECKILKSASDFYKLGTRKGGSIRYHTVCKECICLHNREKYKNIPKYREKIAEIYKSKKGRAMSLLRSAKSRSHKYDDEKIIDFDFIYDRLVAGVCEVTGIAFDFDKPTSSRNNPYAPSIDRIDSTKGYTKENTRLVIWQFNLMKGEMSDDDIYHLCNVIVERKNNGLGL